MTLEKLGVNDVGELEFGMPERGLELEKKEGECRAVVAIFRGI